jgi:hypothetical protein
VPDRMGTVTATSRRHADELTTLVRHDAAPDLGVRPMEPSAFSLESPAVLE